MGGSAYWGMAHWTVMSHMVSVLLLFGAGGAAAFPVALFAAELIAGGRSPRHRFGAFFLFLAVFTVLLTALIFAAIYRTYYASWHADTFSYVWGLQLVGTGLNAFYQFAVIGLRYYFPIGLMGLFAASYWFARRAR